MENYQVDNINLLDLFLKKGYRSYNISFMAEGETEKLFLDLPHTKTPFGVEDWYGKSIINIELNKENEKHQKITERIHMIDNFFANMPVEKLNYFLPKELIESLENKQFKPSIVQNSDFKPVMKTYARLGKRSPLKIIKNGEKYTDDIKDQFGTFQILLSTLWVNNWGFGLNWTVEHIELDPTKDEEMENEPIHQD